MLDEQENVFRLWHLFREQKISRTELRQLSALCLARLKRYFISASTMNHKIAKTLGKSLIENWSKLWTFLKIEGVEPTNNAAERALRPLVIMKRIFQRLPSPEGKQFFERMFTTGVTARIRGVPYFDWLINALHAAQQKEPAPALEPA